MFPECGLQQTCCERNTTDAVIYVKTSRISPVGHSLSTSIQKEKQLILLADKCRLKDTTEYWDAVGSIMPKYVSRRVLYYTYCWWRPHLDNRAPLPVADMITADHSTEKTLFGKLSVTEKIIPSCKGPEQVEGDMNWTVLHGQILAFNGMTMDNYLYEAWLYMLKQRRHRHYCVVLQYIYVRPTLSTCRPPSWRK